MKRLVVAAATVAIALAGCTASAPEPEPEPTATPTPTPTPEPEPEPITVECAPFTGLIDDDGDPAPVVGVKVENSPQARPQTALDAADVVFVEMVEGGQTRFLALYNSEYPEVVGNVRSLRASDAGIIGQWSGEVTLFYSGGMPEQEAIVRNAGVELRVDGVHAGFFRSQDRPRPHNLYVSLEEQVESLNVPEECPAGLFEYLEPEQPESPDDESAPEDDADEIDPDTATDDSGEDAADAATVGEFAARYPSVTSGWAWSDEIEAWERYDNGEPNVSAVTGEQTSATNVVVLHVQVRNMGITDSSGAPIPETHLEGEGALDYFVNGTHQTGTWSKESITAPFEFLDADGDPLILEPGNTWVELLPATGSLSID